MPKQKSKSAPASRKPATVKKGETPAKNSKPAASVAPKKSAVKATSPKGTASAKKGVAGKQATAKKAVNKKAPAKNITKSAPAKKTAKPVVNKAAPEKLATSKKATPKAPAKTSKTASKSAKPASPAPASKSKKAAAAKPAENKKQSKTTISKVKPKPVSKKPKKPFVMPKTSTAKARKYEPQFVKSVLDQAPEENTGPRMRYSDNELKEFRELITRKLDTAKKELGYLQGLITRKDEMGGDDTDNRYMTMEDGSLSMEREQLSQMASRQITFIDHLEKAMMRIENKTYGICRVTGKLIDKARLRAVPHATLSIEAKMGIAK
jgi:RNA polymerase-binding transcription factor DksA